MTREGRLSAHGNCEAATGAGSPHPNPLPKGEGDREAEICKNPVMLDHPIYFDNHATTPVDPRVLEAMLPYFSEIFGNPGSATHDFGRQAREAVDAARETIAAAIGARSREIVFTSGATESNNLAPARRGGKTGP